MARLTKTDAARQLGIARSTLYKLIDQGVLSPTADGMIDSTELVRVAPVVDSLKHRAQAPANTRQTSANIQAMDTQRRDERPHGYAADRDDERPQTPGRERLQTSGDDRSQTYADMLVDLLREQLRHAQEAAQHAREAGQERERAYREHIAHLTVMLDQAHQQNQRLLEAPRSAPAPPMPLSGSPPMPSAAPLPQDPVLAQILRWRQEGLSLRAIAAKLNADGVPTRSGQGRWYQSNLSRLLKRTAPR